ncbi:hypothetical protein HNQ07_000410 [Deinococcus metalli]|uniref:Uncharacterized protein n=1 Tax=Deinococcus metalli TaxID=1141878 RepID=A0A7W8KBC0_9DEIO|nr:hypothetical protein [Deinococcus metalli]MBB5374966.1 hypothetical protein [Deinococcus metalli]GHF32398.1 hypothetical protein GCM10017781_06320 [Deinococcus metalli]
MQRLFVRPVITDQVHQRLSAGLKGQEFADVDVTFSTTALPLGEGTTLMFAHKDVEQAEQARDWYEQQLRKFGYQTGMV